MTNSLFEGNYLLIFIIIGIITVLITTAIIIFKKKEKEDDKKAEDLIPDIRGFYIDLNRLDNYIVHSEEIRIKEKYKDIYRAVSRIHLRKKNNKVGTLRKFKNDFGDLHGYIEKLNQQYIQSENNKYNVLLSDIDGKSLDSQQREAVISDEEHNLVIAGAGSGKTLTISGKVKYLCEAKGVDPKDILLITFTRKAAQEMTDRIANKLGYPVQATTFHKLGLDILKESGEGIYEVRDDMRQFFEGYFSKEINDDKEMLEDLINFFAYYLQLPSDLNNFDSLGEVYEHEKSMDLETIKSKYDKATYIQENKLINTESKLTLKQERVKSLQEIEIANFLFLHGVRYEYESLYKYQEQDGYRKAYRPDFYLPDYDIYIEHFGVDKNNKCPWLSSVEEEKYVEDMNWKKQWHKQNKTKLLCTYSYYFSEGRLLSELEKMLKENGVEFKDVDLADIFNSVYKSQGKKYFSEFISLCCTFISLFKSNGYELDDLAKLDYKSKEYNNNFFRNRLKVFKNIIRKLLVAYNEDLQKSGAYDFSDMINLSTKVIKEGYQVHKYRYVIIDEFQDTSVARYRLIKAILDQTGARLLCVGDDWQSIYRFAGSDISLFTSFEEYFGYTKTMKIEKTYRNSQELIDRIGTFITKNPQQIRKDLKSDKRINNPIFLWYYHNGEYTSELKKMMDFLINVSGQSSSILLLGRTNYDLEIIKNSKLFYGNNPDHLHYRYSEETPISFMTVHRAKGLEADNVILLNFENSIMGFPNKIADDPMLEIVLSKADQYLYAEERRLFYVAVTRTRNRVCILVNGDRPSEFLSEDLQASIGDTAAIKEEQSKSNDTGTLCPRCKTGHLVKRKSKDGSVFVGCSNYPKCNYTEEFDEVKYCPECGAEMKIRKSQHGIFWGCSRYPNCKYKENYK